MNLALFYLSCTLYAQQQIKNLNCPEESTTDPSLEATPPGAVYKEAVGSVSSAFDLILPNELFREGGVRINDDCHALCFSGPASQNSPCEPVLPLENRRAQRLVSLSTCLLCQTTAWLPQQESTKVWLNKIELHVSHDCLLVLILQTPSLKLYYRRNVFIDY